MCKIERRTERRREGRQRQPLRRPRRHLHRQRRFHEQRQRALVARLLLAFVTLDKVGFFVERVREAEVEVASEEGEGGDGFEGGEGLTCEEGRQSVSSNARGTERREKMREGRGNGNQEGSRTKAAVEGESVSTSNGTSGRKRRTLGNLR
jgi:hypothetical protein